MFPYAADAAALLGGLLRKARVKRRLKAAEAAERAGVSRGLLRLIEAGDLGCTVGAVFKVAVAVGLPFFELDAATMPRILEANRETMPLIPKSVRSSLVKIDDDF